MAVLLGGGSAYALGRNKCWLAILALTPLLVRALGTGMKGEVALVCMPILLPIFRRMTPSRFILFTGFLAFVLLFVFPFSQMWRTVNWAKGASLGVGEVASKVVESWETNGFFVTAAQSTAHWLVRGSSAQQGGLVMQLADRDGLIGPVLIEGLTTIFVPRFLWPDKPSYMPGAWFTWYLGRASSPETATTSTAMMLPTELYWMFGIMGVIIGMALIALLYFLTWRYILRQSATGLSPMLALFVLLGRSAELEASHTIYVVSSPPILLVYVLALDKLQKIVFPKLYRFSLGRVRR
jgi:hypothetical protein